MEKLRKRLTALLVQKAEAERRIQSRTSSWIDHGDPERIDREICLLDLRILREEAARKRVKKGAAA